jgi:hypothetical protein
MAAHWVAPTALHWVVQKAGPTAVLLVHHWVRHLVVQMALHWELPKAGLMAVRKAVLLALH